MRADATDGRALDALRFLVAGGINTALTALVYFVSLGFTSPMLAYAMAWATGLCFVMIFYPDRVFVGGTRSLRARLLLGALTVGVFIVGIITLRAMIGLTGEPYFSFLATLAVTTTLNFLGGRRLLRGRT
jgi:putative flippase GtrA